MTTTASMRIVTGRAVAGGLAVLVLLAYAALLVRHTCFVAGGSDSSGYLNEARAIAAGHITERVAAVEALNLQPADAEVFVPLGYKPGPRPGTMVPTYPPGLPLHMAAAALLGGWRIAPFLVSPLAAIGSLLLLFVLAGQLALPFAYRLGAAAALAACPVFVFQAIQPMSDVVATFWTLAALTAALASRGRWWPFAAIAGLSFAVGVWVRPTNVLVVIPLALAIGARASRPQSPGVPAPRDPLARIGLYAPKALLTAAAAATIALIPLAVWNLNVYGSPLRTGYGSILGEFSIAYFPARALHYAWWITAMMSPLALIAFVASAVAALRSDHHRILASAFFCFYLFYSFYGPYDAWWYTRFLLPAIPAVICSAMLLARRIEIAVSGSVSKRLPSQARRPLAIAAAATFIILMVAFGIRLGKSEGILRMAEHEALYPESVAWASGLIPDGAIVIVSQLSGARWYYAHQWSARWEALDPERVRSIRERAPGVEWYALLSPFEIQEVQARAPGKWKLVGKYRDISAWRLGGE